ncbi:hypothetical protein ACVWY3_004681 [Bradyrhizobium sp. USDA 4486]
MVRRETAKRIASASFDLPEIRGKVQKSKRSATTAVQCFACAATSASVPSSYGIPKNRSFQ